MFLASNNPADLFDHHFTRRFKKSSLACVFNAYDYATKVCAKMPKEVAHDFRPLQRRARFEMRWCEMAKRQSGIRASFELNVASNAYHATVRAGPVILTASAVESPYQIVRNAVFRKTLARNCNHMLPFLEKDIEEELEEGDALYAILLYGPTSLKSPTFANIVFPLPDCEMYAEKKIHLFSEFQNMAKSRLARASFTEEVINDAVSPQLLTDIEQASGGET